jgi:pentatricopeptide repeat protein
MEASTPATEVSTEAQEAERERRHQIIQTNNDIAAHASKKELSEAIALFEEAKASNLINSHTYAAALNAYVRCGDLVGARDLFDEIKNSDRWRLDVISFTTMMKGYCSEGNMTRATELLNMMPVSKPAVVPNIRTFNTYLRGCIITGSVALAVEAFDKMRLTYKTAVVPDVSTYESIVALLCQGLQLDKALPLVGRLKDDPTVLNGMAQMNFHVGRAAAMLADWKAMRRALTAAQENMRHINDEAAAEGDTEHNNAGVNVVAGGKRSWKAKMDDSRLESLQMFREHKKQELSNEIENVLTFGEACCAKGKTIPEIRQYYRLCVFSGDSFGEQAADLNGSTSIAGVVVDELLTNLVEKFGVVALLSRLFPGLMSKPLSQLLPKSQPLKPESKKSHSKKPPKSLPAPIKLIDAVRELPVLQHLRNHLVRSVDAGGFIIFDELFKHYENVDPVAAYTVESSVRAESRRPINVEICSGAGEWVVSQAKANDAVNWVSFELRADRVYQTFARSVFSEVSNVAVFGGDAMKILPQRVPANSFALVCVNHPEPPQQSAYSLASQAKHLLDETFMLEMERVLELHGMLTIMTDNAWYSKFLANSISHSAALARLGTPTNRDNRYSGSGGLLCAITYAMAAALDLTGAAEWRVYSNEIPGVPVFEGRPGKDCGHYVDASSYFDR